MWVNVNGGNKAHPQSVEIVHSILLVWFIWNDMGSKVSETSQVISETALYMKDQETGHSTLRSGGFKKQGAYREACLGPAGQVDLRPALWNLKCLFRGLTWVQSCFQSGWSRHLALQASLL